MKSNNTDTKKKQHTFVDLFAGCGGLSLGMEQAGFTPVFANEIWEAAAETYRRNRALSPESVFVGDIKYLVEHFDDFPIPRNVTMVCGGPPCQGFSLTGPRNFDDERNKLYLAVIEIVKQYKPKAFIIENVPGMATLYEGQIKDEILRRFKKLGYNIECKILCAADYGVPQIRKRLIFMGVRKDIGKPKFPEVKFTPENYRTCRDAVSDLPSLEHDMGSEEAEYLQEPLTEYQRLMRGNCTVLHNHLGTNHTQMVKDW